MDIDHKIRWINMQVVESIRAFEKISQPACTTHNKVQRLIRWTKPPDGWTKMNINGSRDTLTCHASWEDSSGMLTANGYLVLKQKLAIVPLKKRKPGVFLRGLKLFRIMATAKISLNHMPNALWIGLMLIQLNHVVREQNKVADALAKMALKSKNDWMSLPQPESELLGLLNDDVLGVPVSRLVCTGI
nr:ribonuclease H [Ipomoea batatas]